MVGRGEGRDNRRIFKSGNFFLKYYTNPFASTRDVEEVIRNV